MFLIENNFIRKIPFLTPTLRKFTKYTPLFEDNLIFAPFNFFGPITKLGSEILAKLHTAVSFDEFLFPEYSTISQTQI